MQRIGQCEFKNHIKCTDLKTKIWPFYQFSEEQYL